MKEKSLVSLFSSGIRVGGPYGGRQQTSPLGSPQPLPSPGNPANEMAVSIVKQRSTTHPYFISS